MYTDFEFANLRLSDFGCILCHINTNSGLREVNIGCDISFTTVKNNHSSIHSVASSAYENVYTATFEIIKNVCNHNIDDIHMSLEESRALVKWLNRRGYHKFKPLIIDNDSTNVCYYGSFNVTEIKIADRIIGLSLTFTSNAPYGFDDEIRFEVTTSKKNELISIWGDSDEIGTIYPVVQVVCLSDGELKIENQTTGNSVYIDNCSAGEIITMDGEHKVITSNNMNHKRLYNDFNYEFLDIDVSEYYGKENIYEVSMPCEITVSYSPIRKVGVM